MPSTNLIAAESSAIASANGAPAYSDFNGDGFDDLAIGVPREVIGTEDDAGAVNLLYGSSSGLQTSSPADQFWTQNSPGVDDTAETRDQFGYSLAAADFNTDGFVDLAVGAPGESIDGVANGGAVHILYGSSSGLQTSSPADQFWTQDSNGVEDSSENRDFFGWSLAAGDFNGDGTIDLVIGVPFEAIGIVDDAGAVNVIFGSSSGLQTSSPADQFWHQNSPGVNDDPTNIEVFGFALG